MRAMNSKNIVRLIVGIIVAAIGAWQFQSNPSNPEPKQSGQNKSAQQGHHSQGGNRPSDGGSPGKAGSNAQNNQTGDFDYYLVSLSWSPAYCVSHPNDQRQCGGRGFGFVLHGLWPQKSAGGYPEDCPVTSQPSHAVIQKTLAFMPSEKLIHHEWMKHGTCTGLSADEYLALADRAYATLRLPKDFQAPEASRNLSIDQILGEFVAANPSLNRDSLSLRCSGKELEEVRVCVDKQLKPMSCGKGVRTQCGRDTVEVRAVR
jgi:ribonuclease T2